MDKHFDIPKEHPNLKFPKSARLHHRSLVEGLFRLGNSFYEFPFRVTWRKLSPEELNKNFRNTVPDGIGKVQMMVTVPKKKRKKAVDRVLMRRRIKEAYRLNRFPLGKKIEENPSIATLGLALVYIHNQNLPFDSIESKVKTVLAKIGSNVEK